jgi:hypothetical protein
MKKSNKKISRKPKDPKTVEAMGKALVEFGKKEYKEGNLDKQSAKVAIRDAANYFIDAAERYGSKNSKIKAKKNYNRAKRIYNQEIEEKLPIKEKSSLTNKITLIVSVLSIITGIISIILGNSREILLSPGASALNWSNIIGYTLIGVGVIFGIFWFSNKKS